MRKLIIDTDCGLDDASAILLALSQKDVQVVGITTVDGNTSLDNVLVNVLRVLRITGREDIPVYKGCATSLVNLPREGAADYHGHDGLGDCDEHEPVSLEKISAEHAVSAIIRLFKEHDGELELICLGPLTNLSVAIRIDPALGTRIKRLCIMGGNYKGRGNTTLTAEYNFYRDPEAAHVVLQELGASCDVTLVAWELCEEHSVAFETAQQVMEQGSPKGEFMTRMYRNFMRNRPLPRFVYCDEMAMASFLRPEIVTATESARFHVELGGHFCRGMAVPDWNPSQGKQESMQPLVTVVTKVDLVRFLQLVRESLL